MNGEAMWSGWVDLDGQGCPLAIGTMVQVTGEDADGRPLEWEGVIVDPPALAWDWSNFGKQMVSSKGVRGTISRILRYRWQRGEAELLLERIAAQVPIVPVPSEVAR